MMIEIKANALYSRADLAEMLAPAGVDVDHFIGRLKARKVFRQLWLGEDLLAAFRAAPALADHDPAPVLPAAENRGNRGRRKGAAGIDPLESLKQLLR